METNPNENSHCQLIPDDTLNQSNQVSIENLKLGKQVTTQPSAFSIPLRSQRTKMHHSSYNNNSQTEITLNHPIMLLEPQKKPFAKIIIYFHIQTFVKKLLLYLRPPQPLSKVQHKIINDKASSFKNQKDFKNTKKKLLLSNLQFDSLQASIVNSCRKVKVKFCNLLEKIFWIIPLIDPYDQKKLIWDGFMSSIRIYLLLWIPIIIAFDEKHLLDFDSISFMVSGFFLFIDIVLQTFTIKFDKGFPVKDRTQLLKYQFNFWTFMEIFSVVIQLTVVVQMQNNVDNFSTLDSSGWIKVFLIVVYLQIRNILQFVEDLQYYVKPSKITSSLVNLIKLVCLILVVLHVFSSVWYAIDQFRILIGTYYEQQGRSTWISNIYGNKWSIVYLESLYFISVTTFTVGYGDIQPQNSFEKTFVIFYMFLCTLQLSYSVNTIGSILTQIKEINSETNKKMTCITEYMRSKSISLALQYKVREYFNFYWLQESQQQKNAQVELIKLLPEDLQINLKLEAAQTLLGKCQFFQNNFSEQFINKLLRESYFQSFQPGVYIQELDNIYIIEQGQIEIVQKQVKLKTLNQYDYFSHNKLLNHMEQTIKYKTSTFTTMLVVPNIKLMQLLNNDEEEYLKLLDKDDPNLIRCYICQKQHKTESCTLVHFIGDKEKIIKKHQFHSFQNRRKIRRPDKTERKMSHVDLDYLYETAEQIQDDLSETINLLYPDLRDMPNFRLQNSPKPSNEEQVNRRMSLLQPQQLGDVSQKHFLLQENQFAMIEQKFQNISLFSKVWQEQIFLLYKQLFNDQPGQAYSNFESLKEYRTFKPEWNLSHVLQEISFLSSSYSQYRIRGNRDRFKMYLLYPMIFYQQYKKLSRSFTKLELLEERDKLSPDDKSIIKLFQNYDKKEQ